MKTEDFQELVQIHADSVVLEGTLAVPRGAKVVVIFAHGAGSSRLSPRNNFVAQELRNASLGTLLFDLLTEEEDLTYENRFDIGKLTDRLKVVTRWLTTQPKMQNLKIGYFGASTGAAAAIFAAADFGEDIGAVVSRGGRPDLAKEVLRDIKASTLLIVGENDDVVVELNQEAYKLLKVEKRLSIVPGATHLFEEPGALEEVARLAAEWFKQHLLS